MQYSVYGTNGTWYVYDTIANHTVPSSLLGKLNYFTKKRDAANEVDRMNKK